VSDAPSAELIAEPTPATPHASETTRSPRQRVAALAVLAAAFLGLAGWITVSTMEARAEAAARQVTAFEDVTGIRVVRVVLTAGGGIVELHYQVLDPDKAVDVHDDEHPPALIDEKTGAIVAVPFHDHAFRELHTAVTYRQLFMNGGGILHRGSTVKVVVGDAIIERIEVG